MSEWRLFKPPWPDPQASICTLHRWLSPVKGKSFWSLQGPALQAYNSIEGEIPRCLKDRVLDLYEGADESSVPHSIDCLMFGSRKARARPYLVISCSQESFSKNVMRIIEATSWWIKFMKDYPGFGGFLLLRYAPMRIGGVGEESERSWVYTSDEYSSLCGMPIFFASGLLGSDATCAPQQATFGNIIYLDDIPFGLTVAHPLTPNNGDLGQQYTQPSNAVIYMDESGDESTSESESTETSVTGTAISFSKLPIIHPEQPQSLSGSPRLVGQVVCKSAGTPSDVVDWALVALNPRYFESLQRGDTNFPFEDVDQEYEIRRQLRYQKRNQTPLQSLSAQVARNVFTDKAPSLFSSEIRGTVSPTNTVMPVFLPDGKQEFRKGFLSANESLVCLAGSRHYLSLNSVVLENEVRPGACGLWVFDLQGNWCGHVVAGIPDTKIAYVARASQIVSDIQKSTGVWPSISPNTRSHQCATAMKDFWPKSSGELRECLAPSLYTASRYDHRKVVRILLNAKADVNAQGSLYGHALQAASEVGHSEVVQILLDAKAEVNTRGGYYGSALQAASARGCSEVVQILLDAKADVNAQGGEYGSALQAASWGGHSEVVRMLLDAKADVNAQGGYYGSALQAVSARGHREVVQMLLDAKADVNAQGGYYGTALQAALSKGHSEVVQMLRDANAEVHVAETDLELNLVTKEDIQGKKKLSTAGSRPESPSREQLAFLGAGFTWSLLSDDQRKDFEFNKP